MVYCNGPFPSGMHLSGRTEKEAKKNIAEAIELHLKSLAEEGIPLRPENGMTETFVAVNV
ncbi:type II toxin-antitoxin system HicB family antitoxin [Methanogenium cariaci]|uniref:type II toxin-antitoxin system HicB family antitoxin n=1 Tax=Methanogenium cariaci TaxID=2197 RepID=UPI001FDF0D72|nr:type II toxin-antitoxin system HicB family antitoxin [Methanogenium cariaci]